jgi:hypothetical protein
MAAQAAAFTAIEKRFPGDSFVSKQTEFGSRLAGETTCARSYFDAVAERVGSGIG